jgi:fatty-acyl-CoA synthase
MLGLMQEAPLCVSDLIEHAARRHAGATITSVRTDGSSVRHGWPDIGRRAAQLANVLVARGVAAGERIATLAWNEHRHLEIYYGVSGIGAVCHTINPRLFPDQIAFIMRDASDTHLLVDAGFLPLVEGIADRLAGSLRTIVVLAGPAGMPATRLGERFQVVEYERFIADGADRIDWPRLDERSACSLCYTSGTTGDPKGVLYSHRSTVLHAYAVNMADVFGLSATDVVLPIVPMFHVNAWGLPYATAMVGAGLAMPGPKLDGASVYRLIEEAGVTFAAGVPTVWLGLLRHMRDAGVRFTRPPRLVVGGAACPVSLARAFEEEYGARVSHAWGMTETSPVGSFNAPKAEHAGESAEDRLARFPRQGRPLYGLAMKAVDGEGREIPQDGKAYGELLIRGPWIASSYFGRTGDPAFTEDGWFRTGDVVTIDEQGFLEIVDRAKDVIKSGGEWISSIALENIAVGHPAVAEAAVVGMRHPKWDERPLLFVVPAAGAAPDREALLAWFAGKVPKWWIPDDVLVVESLPHTATGKLLKTELRRKYADHRMA